MNAEIEKHVDSMRSLLLDYANYHASKNNSELSGTEILDRAISSVMSMPEDRISKMYTTIARDKYNRLDFRLAKRIKFLSKVA